MLYITEIYELHALCEAISEINEYCKDNDMRVVNFEIAAEENRFRVVANLEYIPLDFPPANLGTIDISYANL